MLHLPSLLMPDLSFYFKNDKKKTQWNSTVQILYALKTYDEKCSIAATQDLTIAAVKMSREGKVVAHLVFSRETNFGQHLAILTARLVINASISKK